MESCLEDSIVFPYEIKDRKGDHSSFLFVQSLFHAYLSLIKKESGVGNALLKRDKDGEPVSDSKDAKILFDRRGGTFIFEPEVMSRCFRARCAFVMSLWDMSTKEKLFIPGLKEILEIEGK